MMLPPASTRPRACGRRCKELGVSRHNLVAIGDGENDSRVRVRRARSGGAERRHAREARRESHHAGAYCEGFLELARRSGRDRSRGRDAAPQGHRRCPRERRASRDHAVPRFAARARTERQRQDGAVQSTPRAVAREQYQCCVIDAEIGGLQAPGEVQVFGDAHEVPRLTDILAALDQPTRAWPSIWPRSASRRARCSPRRCWCSCRRCTIVSAGRMRDDPAGAFLRCRRRNGCLGALVGE